MLHGLLLVEEELSSGIISEGIFLMMVEREFCISKMLFHQGVSLEHQVINEKYAQSRSALVRLIGLQEA